MAASAIQPLTSDIYVKHSSRDSILQGLAQTGKVAIPEKEQTRLSKLQMRNVPTMSAPASANRRRKSYRLMDENDKFSPTPKSSVEAKHLLADLKPVYVTPKYQTRVVGQHRGSRGQLSTRPAPSNGFKSLYQLSLMLGKGFTIEDLYLMQENINNSGGGSNKNAIPYHLLHPPVTVTPLRPHSAAVTPQSSSFIDSPTFPFNPLSADSPISAMEMKEKMIERLSSRLSTRKSRSVVMEEDTDAMQYILEDEAAALQYIIPMTEQRSRSSVSEKRAFTDSDLKLEEEPSVTKYLEAGKRFADSATSVEKGDLIENNVFSDEYEDSDEDFEESFEPAEYYPNEPFSVPNKSKSKQLLIEHYSKSQIKPADRDKIVMFAHQQMPPFLGESSRRGTSPSSEDSTKAMASLTSRIGLQDFSSEDRQPTQLSSEKAHPLGNRITPRSALKTYAIAMGKEATKDLQRSHTFSTLESKPKKGKDRLAVSFPTMFQRN